MTAELALVEPYARHWRRVTLQRRRANMEAALPSRVSQPLSASPLAPADRRKVQIEALAAHQPLLPGSSHQPHLFQAPHPVSALAWMHPTGGRAGISAVSSVSHAAVPSFPIPDDTAPWLRSVPKMSMHASSSSSASLLAPPPATDSTHAAARVDPERRSASSTTAGYHGPMTHQGCLSHVTGSVPTMMPSITSIANELRQQRPMPRKPSFI